MRFRPCIDLHNGQVKQIVGSTLSSNSDVGLLTNFESAEPAAHYAQLYKNDGLTGGHIIMLGPGNERAAASALAAYPGGLQIGGGITADNARNWLEEGAAKVIVTSYLFHNGCLSLQRLAALQRVVNREDLVIDLSCRRTAEGYVVVTDKWQSFTDLRINEENLLSLSESCSEFLIHGVDVEGRQQGIEEDLIKLLADFSPIPTTYAGGIRNMKDLEYFTEISSEKLDFTVGSALDIFGGDGMRYDELVALDKKWRKDFP